MGVLRRWLLGGNAINLMADSYPQYSVGKAKTPAETTSPTLSNESPKHSKPEDDAVGCIWWSWAMSMCSIVFCTLISLSRSRT
ncbi:hypothetical protein PIB30_048427 [Stylosanthes scabra]|uniref:Uncharacterized protein n=1 Tax=Stylosanthes scabra TaxID=79078 RepID=A0ABU6TIZ7_9FABA|nr:hypothetical protein [Stylosanthes scabra]